MLKRIPKFLKEWITLILLMFTICSAAFAGTSKLLAIILKSQFDSIYLRISAVEINQKILTERVSGMGGTIDKIWYKVK